MQTLWIKKYNSNNINYYIKKYIDKVDNLVVWQIDFIEHLDKKPSDCGLESVQNFKEDTLNELDETEIDMLQTQFFITIEKRRKN